MVLPPPTLFLSPGFRAGGGGRRVRGCFNLARGPRMGRGGVGVTGGKWGALYSTIHFRGPQVENRVEAAGSRHEAASKAALRLRGWDPGDPQAPSPPLRCPWGPAQAEHQARPVSLQRGAGCGRLGGWESPGSGDREDQLPERAGWGVGGALASSTPPFRRISSPPSPCNSP